MLTNKSPRQTVEIGEFVGLLGLCLLRGALLDGLLVAVFQQMARRPMLGHSPPDALHRVGDPYSFIMLGRAKLALRKFAADAANLRRIRGGGQKAADSPRIGRQSAFFSSEAPFWTASLWLSSSRWQAAQCWGSYSRNTGVSTLQRSVA